MRNTSLKIRNAVRALERADRDPRLLERSFADAGTSVSKAATMAFDTLQSELPARLQGTLDDLLAGQITGAEAATKLGADLRKAHKAAYLLGKERMLGKSASLVADDLFYLDRALGAELKYLDGFVDDVVSGATASKGRMAAGRRLDLYGRAIRGSHNNARVEYAGGPGDKEVLIYWTLNAKESCEDCVSMAGMSPWSKRNLPTCPGCGDTKCGGNCQCTLRFETVSKPSRKRDMPIRPKSARDIWQLPTPPPGLSLPSAEQRLAVESLRSEMNYFRRQAQDLLDAGQDAAAQRAMADRAAVNAKLNKFLRANKVWSPPAFGLDDVLSGKVLDDRLVDALMSIGTDGPTLAALGAKEYRQVIREIIDEVPALSAEIKSILLTSK